VALRRHVVALSCLAAAALLALVAFIDHRWKTARIDRIELAAWYCQRYGTACTGPSHDRVEAQWNEREWGYGIAFALLAGYGIVRLGGDLIVDRATRRRALS
jgi:hypothetical protein